MIFGLRVSRGWIFPGKIDDFDLYCIRFKSKYNHYGGVANITLSKHLPNLCEICIFITACKRLIQKFHGHPLKKRFSVIYVNR